MDKLLIALLKQQVKKYQLIQAFTQMKQHNRQLPVYLSFRDQQTFVSGSQSIPSIEL